MCFAHILDSLSSLSTLIQILLKSIAVLPFRRLVPLNSYFRKCTLLGDNIKQRVDD